MNIQNLKDLISHSIDLTSYMTKGLAARGTLAPNILTNPALNAKRSFSVVSASIHSTTHIEFPWTFRTENIVESDYPEGECPFPPLADPSAEEILKDYHRTKVFRALIIDFSERNTIIENALSNHGIAELDGIPQLLSPDMPSKEYDTLLEELCISFDSIAAKLPTTRLLSGTFLAIYTGWERWRPSFKNIDHPFFEAVHPFLLHPYLDETSIQRLLNAGIEGLGTDTYGSECPLYYIDEYIALPAVKTSHARALSDGKVGRTIAFPPLPPVHYNILRKYKILIEMLYIRGDLFVDHQGLQDPRVRPIPFGDRKLFRKGVVIIQPIQIGNVPEGDSPPDATFARVTFFPEEVVKW